MANLNSDNEFNSNKKISCSSDHSCFFTSPLEFKTKTQIFNGVCAEKCEGLFYSQPITSYKNGADSRPCRLNTYSLKDDLSQSILQPIKEDSSSLIRHLPFTYTYFETVG